MALGRYSLNDLQPKNRGYLLDPGFRRDVGLLPELWEIVFQQLEPLFLRNVLHTCKLFNAVAHANIIFAKFTLFKQLHIYNRSSLSSAGKKLLYLITFLDITEIENLPTIYPDTLFEKDMHGKMLLSYLNEKQSQPLRDLVFQKVNKWFETRAKEKASRDNFFSYFLNYYEDHMRFEVGTRHSFTLMDCAVALNQLAIVKNEKYQKYFLFRRFCNNDVINVFQLACLFGHFEIILYLLSGKNAWWECSYYNDHTHPLSLAVLSGNLEVVGFLLVSQQQHIESYSQMLCTRRNSLSGLSLIH